MPPASEDAAPAAARRVALLVEYDGAAFAGSQLQSSAATVQSALEDAIARATEETVRVAFAGRTDAGVHARGQVASFVTTTRLDNSTLLRAINAWLREEVAVRELTDVPIEFDPRRDARRRHYRYLIDNSDVRPVLERGRAWHVAGALDIAAMSEAAGMILGRHDFAPFASPLEDPTGSTVRELYRFDVGRDGPSVVIDVEANAFLPHQVRRMVGALIAVGRGKSTPAEFRALLDGLPASAGSAAPAQGLYLMQVEYAGPLFQSSISRAGSA